jgi:hypothetical protein
MWPVAVLAGYRIWRCLQISIIELSASSLSPQVRPDAPVIRAASSSTPGGAGLNPQTYLQMLFTCETFCNVISFFSRVQRAQITITTHIISQLE